MLLVILPLCLATTSVHAACTLPAGAERDFIYNGDYHAYQFCDGTSWVVTGGTQSPDTIGAASTFGERTIFNEGDNGNGDVLLAQDATLSRPGTIRSISFYVSLDPAGDLRLGLYDATGPGGGPGTKLAETAGFTPTAGWNTANVITPVALAAGNYWLAYLPSDSGLSFTAERTYGSCKLYSYTYGTLPTTFSTSPSSCAPTHWNLYATITPAAGSACLSPAGNERDIIYSSGSHAYQYCNGASWIPFGGYVPSGGGGGCTGPAGVERNIIYNSDYHAYQFCNGTSWVKFGGAVWQGAKPSGTGYFVMSKSTWNGNLGGLAGADAKCLTELTTNTGWKGYADAKARGILTSGHVRAFLCDFESGFYPGSCNTPQASTTFYFADANNSAHGGNRFTTDANQLGPYDFADWGQESYFGASYTYWSGRSYYDDGAGPDAWHGPNNLSLVRWFNGNFAPNCGSTNSWDNGTSGYSGFVGHAAGGESWPSFAYMRWFSDDPTCDTQEHLICFVNP